jgi:hypothetical protein
MADEKVLKRALKTPYTFEDGQDVVVTNVRLTGGSDLDVGDRVFPIDEMVSLKVTARVTGVNHVIDDHGEVKRQHVLKVIDSEFDRAWSLHDLIEYR